MPEVPGLALLFPGLGLLAVAAGVMVQPWAPGLPSDVTVKVVWRAGPSVEAGWKQEFGLNVPREEGSVSDSHAYVFDCSQASCGKGWAEDRALLLVLAGSGQPDRPAEKLPRVPSVEGNRCRGDARPAAGQGLLTGSLQLAHQPLQNELPIRKGVTHPAWVGF